MKYLNLLFLCINLLWIGNLSYFLLYSRFSYKENSAKLIQPKDEKNLKIDQIYFEEIYRKIISDVRDTFFYVNSQLMKKILNNESVNIQSSLNDRFK